MADRKIWRGYVAARSSTPVSTNLNFRQGAKVTIIADGYASHSDSEEEVMYGSVGRHGMVRPNAYAPEEFIGAVLVKTGSIYTACGGGLVDWSPPTDDNLEFVFNDVPGKFDNNRGGYDATIVYDPDDLGTH